MQSTHLERSSTDRRVGINGVWTVMAASLLPVRKRGRNAQIPLEVLYLEDLGIAINVPVSLHRAETGPVACGASQVLVKTDAHGAWPR